MHLIILTLSEIEILQKYVRTSPLVKIRLMSQAVLMRDRKISISDISGVIGKSESTITSWLRNFSKGRISSIFSGLKNNENAAKLTKEQKLEIKRTVGRRPDNKGIPLLFWDVPGLKNYVRAQFGVVYESNSSYHFLLKFSGLSFKYPDKRSPNRNEKEIKNEILNIKEKVRQLRKHKDTLIFVADETRVQLEAEIRRCWLKKGIRSLVKTQRSKEYQNYLGFLSLDSHKVDLFPIDHGNTKQTIKSLELLLNKYKDKNIVVIWDNATWHKSKLLREKLMTGSSLEKLHLISFPPYAPEHNPIEHVWNYAKSHLANKSTSSFEKIKQEFYNLITNHTFMYQI